MYDSEKDGYGGMNYGNDCQKSSKDGKPVRRPWKDWGRYLTDGARESKKEKEHERGVWASLLRGVPNAADLPYPAPEKGLTAQMNFAGVGASLAAAGIAVTKFPELNDAFTEAARSFSERIRGYVPEALNFG